MEAHECSELTFVSQINDDNDDDDDAGDGAGAAGNAGDGDVCDGDAHHQHCDYVRGDGIRAQPSSKTGSCQPRGCIVLIEIVIINAGRGLRKVTSIFLAVQPPSTRGF